MQEVRAISSFHGPLNFAVGGYYENDRRTLYQGAMNGPEPLDAATGRYETDDSVIRNTADSYSFFAQGTFKILPNLELAGGARYTEETKTIDLRTTYVNPAAVAAFLLVDQPLTGRRSESHVSPEATITWHPAHNVMLYAAYKTGYLSGGYSNPGTPVRSLTIPLITYRAETASGFEGGVKAQLFGNKLSGSLIDYRYTYNGLQLTSLNATLPNPAYQTTNAANTLVQGVEYQMTYRPIAGLTLNASASYNDAHFESFQNAQCYAGETAATGCEPVIVGTTHTTAHNLSGATVYRAPKWVLTLGGVYEFPITDTFKGVLSADVRNTSGYFASVTENPGSYQKGYTLLNAGLRVGPSDGRWSVAVIGRNLTNVIYATVGTDKPGGTGEVFAVAGEPREVVLQLETRF